MYGCLLGYTTIAAEMADPDLRALVEHIAAEGLPVVEDPGLLSPRKFIDEVLHQRFPNPAIPDTPQRIAADTSQKLPVRYGGTLQRYTHAPIWRSPRWNISRWSSRGGAGTCWGWTTPCGRCR